MANGISIIIIVIGKLMFLIRIKDKDIIQRKADFELMMSFLIITGPVMKWPAL